MSLGLQGNAATLFFSPEPQKNHYYTHQQGIAQIIKNKGSLAQFHSGCRNDRENRDVCKHPLHKWLSLHMDFHSQQYGSPPPWEGESNAHIVVGLAEKEYWKGCCCTQRCSTHCAKPLLGICRDLTDLIMLMLNF